MRLILVRHALPFSEAARPGLRADPSLTPQGIAQAERLPDALAHEEIVAIVASPAARALETAGPLAAALGLTVKTDDSVREYDRDGEGYVPIHEAIARRLPEGLAIASGQFPDWVPVEQFRKRVVVGIEAIIDAYPGPGAVAVVCHGGAINAYLAHVLGIPGGMPFPIDYVSVSRVLAARDGRRQVHSVNELLHVRDVVRPREDWPEPAGLTSETQGAAT